MLVPPVQHLWKQGSVSAKAMIQDTAPVVLVSLKWIFETSHKNLFHLKCGELLCKWRICFVNLSRHLDPVKTCKKWAHPFMRRSAKWPLDGLEVVANERACCACFALRRDLTGMLEWAMFRLLKHTCSMAKSTKQRWTSHCGVKLHFSCYSDYMHSGDPCTWGTNKEK